jgi:short-subunit dehydrogenase
MAAPAHPAPPDAEWGLVMEWKNRTALVTGASSGIGAEFAGQLAARGVNLVLVARRADRLEALRGRLAGRHPALDIEIVPADLAAVGATAELAARLHEAGQHIDVLVNNAGVGFHRSFAGEPPDEVAAEIRLNCGALVDLTARFLPGMRDARRGVVINLASTSAFQPVPTMAVYAATKAFVLSFTEALWWESRGSGVRVLALCPGATQTEFFDRSGAAFMTRGRQSAAQVVVAALSAVDGTSPTVVPGEMNKLRTMGYRLMPRSVMPRLAERTVR